MGFFDFMKGNTYGFQESLGTQLDQGISHSKVYQGHKTGDLHSIRSGNRRLLDMYPQGQGRTAALRASQAHFQREGMLAGIQRQGFRGLAAAEGGILNFSNKINDHLNRTKRGVAGGFKSVGSVMSRMPLKHLAKSYAIGTPFMIGAEVALMGKPLSFSTIGEAAWHNIPFTLSMELAGGGAMGIAKGMGYGLLGSAMGLGPWGTLALQVAGSTYLPGLGPTAGIVMGAYQAGKGMYEMHKEMYKMGKAMRKTEFVTGDMSYATAEAATMRQRSIGAIQKSHMNMRSMLGREATILMGR